MALPVRHHDTGESRPQRWQPFREFEDRISSPISYAESQRLGTQMREDGVAEDALARIHVPIGLDLGAQSAPEIALAVLAEVLAVQRGATGLPISEKVKRGIK